MSHVLVDLVNKTMLIINLNVTVSMEPYFVKRSLD